MHGAEAAAVKSSRRQGPSWTRESAESWLRQHLPQELRVFEAVNAAFNAEGLSIEWTASLSPSCVVKVDLPDGAVAWPYRIQWRLQDSSILELHVHHVNRASEPDQERFLESLAAVPGLHVDAEEVSDAWLTKLRAAIDLGVNRAIEVQTPAVLRLGRRLRVGDLLRTPWGIQIRGVAGQAFRR